MRQDEQTTQRDIVEQLPYLNELMVAIRNVNDAILNGKDAREAAENLLSDLPEEWLKEIDVKVSVEKSKYNRIIESQNKFLSTGYTPKQKYSAQKAIYIAGNNYSRNIKMIVISLLKQKDLLFKTRKKVEEGSLSLYALEEGTTDEG